MSSRSRFLLCNEVPVCHFPPKDVHFFAVEDLLREESFSLCVIFEFESGFLARTFTFAVCFRKIAVRSRGRADEIQGKCFAEKTYDNRSRRKQSLTARWMTIPEVFGLPPSVHVPVRVSRADCVFRVHNFDGSLYSPES
ncbi:hypothetical protein AVEN_260450-1 [Araneus ventricosus]|uniref:Uncharacterized protein n=1 Tax=Araneus ventricosus TaxID=182803 RepID=A0A4Y2IL29_ARAVE|nr:hypothetical protein AVEN_260450-1 [Araneus ventricosus]